MASGPGAGSKPDANQPPPASAGAVSAAAASVGVAGASSSSGAAAAAAATLAQKQQQALQKQKQQQMWIKQAMDARKRLMQFEAHDRKRVRDRNANNLVPALIRFPPLQACKPDLNTPFSSLDDAINRLAAYQVFDTHLPTADKAEECEPRARTPARPPSFIPRSDRSAHILFVCVCPSVTCYHHQLTRTWRCTRSCSRNACTKWSGAITPQCGTRQAARLCL